MSRVNDALVELGFKARVELLKPEEPNPGETIQEALERIEAVLKIEPEGEAHAGK